MNDILYHIVSPKKGSNRDLNFNKEDLKNRLLNCCILTFLKDLTSVEQQVLLITFILKAFTKDELVNNNLLGEYNSKLTVIPKNNKNKILELLVLISQKEDSKVVGLAVENIKIVAKNQNFDNLLSDAKKSYNPDTNLNNHQQTTSDTFSENIEKQVVSGFIFIDNDSIRIQNNSEIIIIRNTSIINTRLKQLYLHIEAIKGKRIEVKFLFNQNIKKFTDKLSLISCQNKSPDLSIVQKDTSHIDNHCENYMPKNLDEMSNSISSSSIENKKVSFNLNNEIESLDSIEIDLDTVYSRRLDYLDDKANINKTPKQIIYKNEKESADSDGYNNRKIRQTKCKKLKNENKKFQPKTTSKCKQDINSTNFAGISDSSALSKESLSISLSSQGSIENVNTYRNTIIKEKELPMQNKNNHNLSNNVRYQTGENNIVKNLESEGNDVNLSNTVRYQTEENSIGKNLENENNDFFCNKSKDKHYENPVECDKYFSGSFDIELDSLEELKTKTLSKSSKNKNCISTLSSCSNELPATPERSTKTIKRRSLSNKKKKRSLLLFKPRKKLQVRFSNKIKKASFFKKKPIFDESIKKKIEKFFKLQEQVVKLKKDKELSNLRKSKEKLIKQVSYKALQLQLY